MAIMTSQAEPATLDEKAQSQLLNKAAPVANNTETKSTELNGHTIPAISKAEATNTANIDSENDAPSQLSLKNSEVSNKDAFVSNQTVSTMTSPSGDVGEPAAVLGTTNHNGGVTAHPNKAEDTEMLLDVPPAASATSPSPPTGSADADKAATTLNAPSMPVEGTKPNPSATESPAATRNDKPFLKTGPPIAQDSTQDIAEDEDVAESASQAAEVEKVQQSPSTRVMAEKLLSPCTVSPKVNLDGSRHTAAPVTTDHSITTTQSHSCAKLAREREGDGEDEPIAKRARTSDEVSAQTELSSEIQVPVVCSADAMALDPPVITQATSAESAAPAATLPSTELNPPVSRAVTPAWVADAVANMDAISPFHSREIRKVLGLVKKTKHGTHFRASVRQLWPGVWDQYRASIQRPVDISFIEQNLREGNYATMSDLKRDVQLIEENAVTFNGTNHDVAMSARSTVKAIYERITGLPAEEPVRPAKHVVKQLPTRRSEPRKPHPAKKDSRPSVPAPADKNNDPQIFSLLPSGLPNIRRDSTKNDGDRPKRPIHPPKNKDIGYAIKTGKSKKKPELKFCEEVLKEIKSSKHWIHNQWFLEAVDPVALNIPTYFSMIKRPMDLGTMDEKLQRGEYEAAKDFKADFELIVKNCVTFNGDSHIVAGAAKELQNIFSKKWADKASWISKHAPPTPAPSSATATLRGAAKEESDDDDASEAEQQDGSSAEIQELERAIETLTDRLKQEQTEMDKKIFAPTPDPMAIDLHRGIITHLQNQLVEKRHAQNKLVQSKKSAPIKPSKKKAAGGGGLSNSTAKKTGGGTNATRKNNAGLAKKPAKKKLNDQEKEIVSDAIANLESNALEKAISIIKQDTGLKTDDDELELELDMDQLSDRALVQLFELVMKAFPHYKDQLKKSEPLPAAAQPSKSSKPKKNKPMGKAEQERKLEQLRELKNSYKRPGSGSQEPLLSMENDGARPGTTHHEDSDDASSSEEE